MKNILAVFALFLVVFSSGCTVPGLNIEIPFLPDIFGGMNVKEQTHDVISIESLDVIPSTTVRSGQSVILRAVVKNLQSPEYRPVINVDITLFNSCSMFDVQDYFCQDTWNPTSTPSTPEHTCRITKMHPQYTAIVQWKLTANDINVETPCKVGVMARYSYITYSTTSVTFINKAELERIVAEGKSFSETGTLSISEGPVKPYVEVLKQPIVIDILGTNPRNKGSGIMSFWLENKGGGYIDTCEASKGNVQIGGCASAYTETGTNCNKMCLAINSTPMGAGTGAGGESIKAIKTDTENEILLADCIKQHLDISNTGRYGVNFIGKKTPPYSCSITVAQPDRIKQELTYQIMAQIGYFYKFTKETTITVQPRIKL